MNMGVDSNLHAKPRRRANFRSCNVSRYVMQSIHIYFEHEYFFFCFIIYVSFLFSYTSEVLEIQSDAPTLHVLFFPGNPGVASIVCVCTCITFFDMDLFSGGGFSKKK